MASRRAPIVVCCRCSSIALFANLKALSACSWPAAAGSAKRSTPVWMRSRALTRSEDRRPRGLLKRSRKAGHLRGLLVQPAHVAVGERAQLLSEVASRCLAQFRHGQFEAGEQCPFPSWRRDCGGHLVRGQPCRLQPVGAPLAVAGMCVDGHVAADGVPQLVAVQEPQLAVLRIASPARQYPQAGRRSGRRRRGRLSTAVTTSFGWNSHAVSLFAGGSSCAFTRLISTTRR